MSHNEDEKQRDWALGRRHLSITFKIENLIFRLSIRVNASAFSDAFSHLLHAFLISQFALHGGLNDYEIDA